MCEFLIARFSSVFPQIHYDVLWDSNTCNGHAFLLNDIRHVRLYGGLLRHKNVGLAGLAVCLAHETGHHLGGPPYHEFYPWLSSEAQADTWAYETGLRVVFGPKKAAIYVANGRRQLSRVLLTLTN
jgi:hypothetical protein